MPKRGGAASSSGAGPVEGTPVPPKKKKKAAVPPTINFHINNTYNHNTIHKYFARTPGPAPAPAPLEGPPPLFATDAERYVKTFRKGDKMQIYEVGITRKHKLVGGCHNTCKNTCVSLEQFAPDADSKVSAANRQRFDAAVDAFKAAVDAKDKKAALKARDQLVDLRTNFCDRCSKAMKKLSPAKQACKDFYDGLKKAACRVNDGCAHSDCTERGMAAWVALTADHGTNHKQQRWDKVQEKWVPVQLGDYIWWGCNGGVPAMREEAKQIDKWICHSCHALEPTSDSGCINDPADMEQCDEETDKQFCARKRHAEITFPKYAHVNARKREVGHCEYTGCERPVVTGKEQAFDWDHRVESTKRKCRCENSTGKLKGPCHGCEDALFRRAGGVGGLTANNIKRSALDTIVRYADGNPCTVRNLLDTEMDKCDLLCRSCHLGRKDRGRARWDDSE